MGGHGMKLAKCEHGVVRAVECRTCNALDDVRRAARFLATLTTKQIGALAERETTDKDADLVCSMLYAAREAVDMRRVR